MKIEGMAVRDRFIRWLNGLDDINGRKPEDYGILETPATTIVYHLFPSSLPNQPLTGFDISDRRGAAVWLTTRLPDVDTYWVIGPDGRRSKIGINWDWLYGNVYVRNLDEGFVHVEQLPDLPIAGLPKDAQGARVIRATYLLQPYMPATQYILCVRLAGNSWDQNIAPAVSGWGLISGKNVRSGPLRDWFASRRLTDLPFANAPLAISAAKATAK